MRLANQVKLLLVIAASLACAPGRGANTPRPDRSILTQESLRDQHYENVYQAVEALRSNWLISRGPDSFTSPSVVLVYMDNVKLGGVEWLRTVPISAVSTIQHLDPNEATARYGIGHGAGVILLKSFAAATKAPVDPSESVRVIENDAKRVTGLEPAFRADSAAGARQVELVGTLGRSALIARLQQSGRREYKMFLFDAPP